MLYCVAFDEYTVNAYVCAIHDISGSEYRFKIDENDIN